MTQPKAEPAEQAQDSEAQDITDALRNVLDNGVITKEDEAPGALSEAAQQTLDDIDGPLDDDQADEGPDPREATADRIIADINRAATVIDLQHVRSREKLTVEALPNEIAERIKVAYSAREAALKGSAA